MGGEENKREAEKRRGLKAVFENLYSIVLYSKVKYMIPLHVEDPEVAHVPLP